MSSPTAHLAVDLGSASIRVMLGVIDDASGEPTMTVRETGRTPNVPRHQPDGLGWDVPALWEGVCDGLRAAVDAAREAGAEVRGIGVDAWGVDYARLTTDGRVRPFMRHHRDADPEAFARSASERDVAAEYRMTGVLDQAINTVHQLRQDAAAGIGSAQDTILLTADLFVYLLTGRVGAEPSLASTTGLLDRASGTWSPRLTAGLPARFPPVLPFAATAAHTTAPVTATLGLDSPAPVWAVTAHDTAAAFMAVTDADDPGTAVVSCGSWAVVGAAIDAPILTEHARAAGFTQELGAGGDTLIVRNLSGMWLVQQSLREWAAEDAAAGRSPQQLSDLLATAATSTYAGTFDPADPAFQAPGGLTDRLRVACARTAGEAPASRGDLLRAILDSLAIAYAQAIGEVERLTGRRTERVRIVGGGARNELLCALTARRAGLPVIAGPAEASVRGVLLQTAIAAGELADAATARTLRVEDGEGPARVFRASDSSAPAAGNHHRPNGVRP